MELEELQSRMEHLRHLESRENGPETPQKAYLTMEDSEKNRYIEFLLQQKEERDRTIAEKDAFIKNLQDTLDMLKSMHESDSKKIDELKTAHEEDARKMDKLISSINDLTAQLKLKNKQTYADKGQKGISKKGKVDSTTKPKDRDRDENAHLGDMMQKALRYLNKFWKQLFTFSFNQTFIATCQMMGLSVLKYFKSLFSAIAKGRTNYERSALPLVPVRVSRICCL